MHHPLDAYATRAATDGLDSVLLEPGDALTIPSHWPGAAPKASADARAGRRRVAAVGAGDLSRVGAG